MKSCTAEMFVGHPCWGCNKIPQTIRVCTRSLILANILILNVQKFSLSWCLAYQASICHVLKSNTVFQSTRSFLGKWEIQRVYKNIQDVGKKTNASLINFLIPQRVHFNIYFNAYQMCLSECVLKYQLNFKCETQRFIMQDATHRRVNVCDGMGRQTCRSWKWHRRPGSDSRGTPPLTDSYIPSLKIQPLFVQYPFITFSTHYYSNNYILLS